MLVPWLAALDDARTLRGALGAGARLLPRLLARACSAGSPVAIAGYTGAPRGSRLARARAAGAAAAPAAGAGVRVGAPRWRAAAARARCASRGSSAPAPGSAPSGCCRSSSPTASATASCPRRWLCAGGRPRRRRRAQLRAAAGERDARSPRCAPLRLAAAALRAARGAPSGARRRWRRSRCSRSTARCACARSTRELADVPRVTAGLVQANIAHYGSLAQPASAPSTRSPSILEAHLALSHQALAHAPLDLLVWPETVYPTTFGAPKSEDGAAFDRALAALVARTARAARVRRLRRPTARRVQRGGAARADGDGRVELRHLPQGRALPADRDACPPGSTRLGCASAGPGSARWQPGAGARVLPLRLADGRDDPRGAAHLLRRHRRRVSRATPRATAPS